MKPKRKGESMQRRAQNVPEGALRERVAHFVEVGHDSGPVVGGEGQVVEYGDEDILVDLGGPFHQLARSH